MRAIEVARSLSIATLFDIFNANFRALAAQHPELKAVTEFSNKHARLLCCIALLASIGAAMAAEMPAAQGPQLQAPEEIAVYGRRGRLALRAEIVNIETRMFDLFNALNDERQFDVSCEEGIVTGSRIPERKCAPRYMNHARMNTAQQFLFSDLLGPKPELNTGSNWAPGISMNTVGAQGLTDEQLWLQNNPKHRAFNEKFRALAVQHPELNAIMLDWQARQRLLADLEAKGKEESALGRFFGKFGAKDEN